MSWPCVGLTEPDPRSAKDPFVGMAQKLAALSALPVESPRDQHERAARLEGVLREMASEPDPLIEITAAGKLAFMPREGQ